MFVCSFMAPKMTVALQRKAFEAEVATLEQSKGMFEKLK
jgi:hypothetical protein